MSKPPVVAGDFTRQAAFYARARPGYPAEFVSQLIRQVALAPGSLVVDVGAGTGISSRILADHGLRVIAVEPNAAMRAEATACGDVTWQAGSFEATGLAAGSADWVVAAQAFHWADPQRALPEMRRVLKPQRWFTVFWNDRDTESSRLLTATMAIIRARVPAFDEAYRERDWGGVLRSTGDFAGVQHVEQRHEVLMSPQRFLDLWRSHNRLGAMAGETGLAAIVAELERLLAAQGTGDVPVPYVCRAWSVQRR